MTCIEGSMFLDFTSASLAMLAGSAMGGLIPGKKITDLFCGAGGWTASKRLKAAGFEVHYAINHAQEAIRIHAENNPDCVHHMGDAWKARPEEVMGDDELDVLLASAACTSHSNARGGAPISPRVHMLGWCIGKWVKEKRPRVVWIENVPEWQKWGPTIIKRDKRGRKMRDKTTGKLLRVADKSRLGTHFRRLIRFFKKLGYAVEYRVFDAADFGNPSRRKRLFMQLRRDGMPICWPEPTHAPRKEAAALGLKPHVGACEIIDWSDLGRSIFDGKRTKKSWGGTRLAKNTLARTCEGIGRFVLEAERGSPFSLRVSYGAGKGWKVSELSDPLPTQTGRQDLAAVAPVMMQTSMQGGNGACVRASSDPLATLTTCQDMGMVVPIIAPQNTGVYGQGVEDAGPTITTKGHQSIAAAVLATTRNGERKGQRPPANPVSEPANTVVNGPTQGVATAVMVSAAHGSGGGRGNAGRVRPPADPIGAIHAGGNNFGIATAVLLGAGGSEYAGQPKPIDRPLNTVKCDNSIGVAIPLCLPAGGPEANAAPTSDPLGTVLTRDHRGLATPVMIAQRNNATGTDIVEPAPALCAGGTHQTVATPVLMSNRHGDKQWKSVEEPANTLCAGGTHHGIVTPLLSEQYSRGSGLCAKPADGQLGCVPIRDRHGLAGPIMLAGPMAPGMRERAKKVGRLLKRFLGDRVPLNSEGMALAIVEGVEYIIVDILFRMLRVPELAAAMGFPPDFVLPKVQREAVKLIGNAVSPIQAEALLLASFPHLRPIADRKAVAA